MRLGDKIFTGLFLTSALALGILALGFLYKGDYLPAIFDLVAAVTLILSCRQLFRPQIKQDRD